MQPILLVMAALALQTGAVGDEPVTKYRLVTPKDDGIEATALNGRGDLVGFEWVEEKNQPGVISQVPFCARGKTLITLPLLAGYTTTHPAAISDTGLVVGRAGKPAARGQNVYLRNQAFIWDEAAGIRGLGALKDDMASFACGVTRDGKCISGVSIGDGRTRACVWERVGDAWQGTALPQAGQLGSQVVVISGNGRYVASIDREVPCLWSRSDNGFLGPRGDRRIRLPGAPGGQQFRHRRWPEPSARRFDACGDLDARSGNHPTGKTKRVRAVGSQRNQ